MSECCKHRFSKRFCFCHRCHGYDPNYAGFECDIEKERIQKEKNS